jgi:hypothetical protein
LHWDLYRPGAGWFAEQNPVSEPLEVVVSVMDTAPQRSFLPLIIRDTEPVEVCSELRANGGQNQIKSGNSLAACGS